MIFFLLFNLVLLKILHPFLARWRTRCPCVTPTLRTTYTYGTYHNRYYVYSYPPSSPGVLKSESPLSTPTVPARRLRSTSTRCQAESSSLRLEALLRTAPEPRSRCRYRYPSRSSRPKKSLCGGRGAVFTNNSLFWPLDEIGKVGLYLNYCSIKTDTISRKGRAVKLKFTFFYT